MPILCSINENWDVETRKTSFDSRLMPNKIGNHPALSNVKL
jgi:hypothetical protein